MPVHLKTLQIAVLALGSILANGGASANCICRCVNGVSQPVCTSGYDVEPSCPPRLCPVPPRPPAQVEAVPVFPEKTRFCEFKQVLNERTGQYERKKVCD